MEVAPYVSVHAGTCPSHIPPRAPATDPGQACTSDIFGVRFLIEVQALLQHHGLWCNVP